MVHCASGLRCCCCCCGCCWCGSDCDRWSPPAAAAAVAWSSAADVISQASTHARARRCSRAAGRDHPRMHVRLLTSSAGRETREKVGGRRAVEIPDHRRRRRLDSRATRHQLRIPAVWSWLKSVLFVLSIAALYSLSEWARSHKGPIYYDKYRRLDP